MLIGLKRTNSKIDSDLNLSRLKPSTIYDSTKPCHSSCFSSVSEDTSRTRKCWYFAKKFGVSNNLSHVALLEMISSLSIHVISQILLFQSGPIKSEKLLTNSPIIFFLGRLLQQLERLKYRKPGFLLSLTRH